MSRNFTIVLSLVLLSLSLFFTSRSSAQCSNNNTYWADLSTTFNGDIASTTCAYGGEHYTATVCNGVTYEISTCGTTWDTQITLYSSTGTYLAYNDDGCADANGGSIIQWTSNMDGVIHILVDLYNCQSNSSCVTLSVEQIGSCAPDVDGCPNDNVLYNVNATPTGVGNTLTVSNVYAGEYLNINVCQGASYTFASCGATYDTQLTLYSSSGTLLAHNDDGCGLQSSITWTATMTGTVRLLLDQYISSGNQCGSNSTSTPVTITQNTACPNICSFTSVTATNGGCIGSDNLFNFIANYSGACTIDGMWVYTTANGWEYVDFTVTYTSGQTIPLYLAYSNTTYSYYFVLSNGVESNTYSLTTSNCQAGACPNDNVVYDVNATPTGVGNTVTVGNMWAGEYVNVNVCQGASYTFASCGASYDTQLSLYTPAGVLLAHNDDGCGLQSSITWTSTLTGAVRLLLDQYVSSGNPCGSNSTTTPVTITQNTACANTCAVTSVTATNMGCVGQDQLINFVVNYTGACTVIGAWSYTTINGWEYLEFTNTYTSGQTIGLYLGVDNTQYTFNFVLSNEVESNDYVLTTSQCPAACNISSVTHQSAGCQGTSNLVNFTVNYTGACNVASMWINTGTGWQEVVLTGDFTSGEQIGMLLNLSNTVYQYYFELSDGTLSQTYSYTSINCNTPTCNITSVSYQSAGCEGNANLVYFTVNYTGTCDVASFWSNTGNGWEEAVLPGTYPSGTPIGMLLNLSNTQYQYYFELTNGSISSTYTYTTINCNQPTCSNLNINYTDTGCETINGEPQPTGDITPTFTGACTVAGIYTSVDGGAYEYLDLSAYNITSGVPIGLFFPYQGSNYVVYYVLNNGAASPTTTFDALPCGSGETICDCAGTQLPIEALSWLGDGSLDDGTYFWAQNPNLPVDFNCVMWGFDCGDELEEGYIAYDPYGTCAGNIPPASGCIPESCYMVSLDVLTDCYPEEVSIAVFNDGGDLVVEIPEGTFTADYTFYEIQMCLPAGCYSYSIYDSAGDGMSYDGCAADGQFGVYDYVNEEYFFQQNGDAYSFQYTTDFCVGPEVSCQNLQMSISNEPCVSVQGEPVTPHISFVFNYTGDCVVGTLHLSANGGAFEVIDAFDNQWESGDMGDLFNLQPNTNYVVYYTNSDGSTSPLYGFSTGNCNNETTICDCLGNQHSIGVTTWLGDGFADNSFYEWDGELVNFNCATWGYDCGDISGAPSSDPYNVCNGQLPPYNGCSPTNVVLGCTDPTALNYNPLATVNNGTCIYNTQAGCMDEDACNYNPTAVVDNGTCEYISCVGCTDPDANNYDPTATVDDGSCNYSVISGCTNPTALNYNPLATQDDGSCVFTCLWPTVMYDSYCMQGDLNNFYVDIDLNALGNGAPYTITNSYNNQQQVMSLMGSVTMGPFPIGVQVVVQVTSNTLDCSPLSSAPLSENCSVAGVYGCTDPQAINYNPQATIDDGTCDYEINVGEIESPTTLVLYPNPAKNQVSILNKGFDSNFQIIVLDNMGRRVIAEQAIIANGNSYLMNVSELAQGHYHVQILSNGKVEHRSLIIQKQKLA